MNAIDIINKKKQGSELSCKEISFFIKGMVEGIIPDYQVSAWAMAVFFQGMSRKETYALTECMLNSGDTIDLSQIEGIKVDKHSTGGVGDTTSLVVAPLVAAAGVSVAKMSGRGLGHTGGTIDKLAAINGFRTEMEIADFISQVQRLGIALVGQTGNLVPADKKLYALRDVTATVDSIPLIAGSIMSKKLAAGADAIVLDVKCGQGSFFSDLTKTKELASLMVDIGNYFGKKTVAILSDMSQPLGEAVGNSLEIVEAVLTLKGKGPRDLTELCLALASEMIVLGGKLNNIKESRKLAEELLENGKALEKFKEFIKAQNGIPDFISNFNLLPQAKIVRKVSSPAEGYIADINSREIGNACKILGAGRIKKDDAINLAAGVLLKKKKGDKIFLGEVLLEIHGDNELLINEAQKILLSSYSFSNEPVSENKLILGRIE